MDAKQSVNAGARLDRLPISRLHWRILGLIAAGATLDAFDIYLAGGVVAAMLKEGFATTQQSAVFISTTFFGMLIGAGFAGYLGDRMGRRYSYQFNLALFGVAGRWPAPPKRLMSKRCPFGVLACLPERFVALGTCLRSARPLPRCDPNRLFKRRPT